MAWLGFWASLTCVGAFHIKSAGPAVVLVFITLDWMLGIGGPCVGVASTCVVVAVVVGRIVLLIHLDGL